MWVREGKTRQRKRLSAPALITLYNNNNGNGLLVGEDCGEIPACLLLVAWVHVRPPSNISAGLYELVCPSASHDAPPHLQPGGGSERGHCSCHFEACRMHL